MSRTDQHDTTPVGAGVTAPRREWTEATQGLAIVMVVCFHVTLYLQSVGVDALLGRAKALFELFPMPAFMLVAGMAAANHHRMTFRSLWTRRLVPLLYLYALWSVIRTLFYVVVPGLEGELGELPAADPLTLLLILVWPSSSYWFLYALLLFTAARWAIARLPVWVQLCGTGAVSALVSSGLLASDNLGWNRVGALFFFFTAGALLSKPLRRAVAASRGWHLLCVAVLLAAAVSGLLLGLRAVPGVALLGQCAAVALGVGLVARLPASGTVRRGLQAIGAESLRVYLVHLFVIVPAAALTALLAPDWPRAVDVTVQVALVVLALLISLQLARLMRRARWLVSPPSWLTLRPARSRAM